MLPSLMGIDRFLPTWYASCALWLDPSWGVQTDSAGNFVKASTQYLSLSSVPSGISWSSGSGWVSAVVRATSTGPFDNGIASTRSGLSGWAIAQYADRKFRGVIGTGVGLLNLTSSTVATLGTAYHVYLEMSGGVASMYINGVRESGPTGTPFVISSGLFEIGRFGSESYDGQIESVFVGTNPSASIPAALYNAGNFRNSLTPTEASAWGAVAGLLTNAQSSLTADSIGTNTLTNNNAVTVGAGAILTPAYFGSNVSRELSRQNPANLLTQPTYASRPTFQVATGRPYIRGDGSNDTLLGAIGTSLSGDMTVSQVVRASSNPTAGTVAFDVAQAAAVGLRVTWEASGALRMQGSGGPGAAVTSGTGFADGNPHVVQITRVGTTYTFWLDGVLVGSDATGTAPTYTRLALLADAAGANFAACDVGRNTLYSRGLSVAELQRVRGYMTAA